MNSSSTPTTGVRSTADRAGRLELGCLDRRAGPSTLAEEKLRLTARDPAAAPRPSGRLRRARARRTGRCPPRPGTRWPSRAATDGPRVVTVADPADRAARRARGLRRAHGRPARGHLARRALRRDAVHAGAAACCSPTCCAHRPVRAAGEAVVTRADRGVGAAGGLVDARVVRRTVDEVTGATAAVPVDRSHGGARCLGQSPSVVGAPTRSRVEADLRRPRTRGVAMAPRRRRALARSTCAAPGTRLRVRPRRRRRRAARPAQPPGSRTACTARAGRSTRRAFAWTDADWRGPRRRLLGAVLYELHVGTFTPEGTLDAAHRPARPPRRPRRRRRRADAGRRLPRPTGAGATTGSASAPCTRPTAARRPCSASSTPAHARGLGRLPRRRATTTSARRATTWRGSARTSPPTHHTPWGAGGQPRRRATPAPVRRSSSTTRCTGSATSTSTRCAWTPSTRSRTTRRAHLLAELADAVAALSARAGPAARPGRRVRPQRRRAWSPRRAAGGLRHGRPVGRRRAPRAARVPDRRDARLLRRLRRRRDDAGQGARPRCFVHDGTLLDVPRQRLGRARCPTRLDRRRVRGLRRRTTTRSATGRSGDRPRPRARAGRLAAGAALLLLGPVHPDAVHGRGVGRRRRPASSSPTSTTELARRGPARAAAPSSPAHGWGALRRRRCPTRRTRRRSRRPARLVRAGRRRPRRSCWPGTAR